MIDDKIESAFMIILYSNILTNLCFKNQITIPKKYFICLYLQ